jgi:hypothetical protein
MAALACCMMWNLSYTMRQCGEPTAQCQSVRLPHVYASRLDAPPLGERSSLPEKMCPVFPSYVLAQTIAARRFPGAHHCHELLSRAPCGSHPLPFAGEPVGAGRPASVPGTAGRSPAPCYPPNRIGRPTCRAAALSQACPTASSKRCLKGALLASSRNTPTSGRRACVAPIGPKSCSPQWNADADTHGSRPL